MQLVWQLKNLIRLDGQTQAWSNLSIKRFKERFIDLKTCRLHHRKGKKADDITICVDGMLYILLLQVQYLNGKKVPDC